MVFASRYGDVERSLESIENMVAGEPVSPAAFATSVHNSIAAMSSIARGDVEDTICIAAGTASAAAGFVEAAALLENGAERALLVCYDEPLPPTHASFADEAPVLWAWAWLLGHACADQPAIGVRCRRRTTEDAPPPSSTQLPAGLQVLRFFISGAGTLQQTQDGLCWEWWRDA